MLTKETQVHLRRLMTARVLVVTTLLVSAFLIELAFAPARSLAPLYRLSVAAYLAILAWALLDGAFGRRTWFAYLQVIGDVALVTAFVGATGGADSPMTFLYVLPVVAATVLLYRRGGLLVAALCWLCYAGLLGLRVGGWVPGTTPVEPVPLGRLFYDLLSHLLGFFVVAYLASYLAERLRATDQELRARRHDLAALRALNDHIVESINSGLLTTDLQGAITFVNPAGAAITGRTAGELVGSDPRELFGLEPSFFDTTSRVLRRNQRFRFEKYWTRACGRELFLGLAVSELRNREGASIGYLLMYQDLTEIDRREKKVRLKERMAALGEMAAGIAHELRNPLASITGSVQVLRGAARPHGEETELMEIVIRESERLDRTIRDFLLFARPPQFAPRRTDLRVLIEDVVRLLRNSPEFREGHRVEVAVEGRPAASLVDPDRIKQVFWNLVQNALRAMPRGGTLAIRLAPRGEEHVAIEFRDEGRGMSDDEVRAYFQPFSGGFRSGAGLGGAIVYRLVQEHGGEVVVWSRPEEGTRVTVVLPHRTERASVAPAAGTTPVVAAG
jgi:two-component system sensor histidine kinase PilS (NtrC family)